MVELQTRKYRCRVVEAELPRLNYICGSVAEVLRGNAIRGGTYAELLRRIYNGRRRGSDIHGRNCLAVVGGKRLTRIGESRQSDRGGTTLAGNMDIGARHVEVGGGGRACS